MIYKLHFNFFDIIIISDFSNLLNTIFKSNSLIIIYELY